MTCEMVFRYVVDIQFIASLSNIRTLRRLVLILIPLHTASCLPWYHLHMPSSINFPSSSTDLTIPISRWDSNRAVLALSKLLQFGTNRYIWFACLLSKSNYFCLGILCCSATRAHQWHSKVHQESCMVDSLHFVNLLCIYTPIVLRHRWSSIEVCDNPQDECLSECPTRTQKTTMIRKEDRILER